MSLIRSRRFFTLLVVVFTLALTSTIVFAQTILDHFDLGAQQSLVATNCGTPSVTTDFDASQDPGLPGGERDVEVLMTGCTINGTGIDVFTGGGIHTLSISEGNDVGGIVTITWDGVDGAAALNPTGLGNMSLGNGGANDAFHIQVNSSDLGGTLTIIAYTDGGNYSTYPISVTPSLTPKHYTAPFSLFTISSGTGADFNDIGAIQLVVDGSAPTTLGLDINIDLFEVNSRDFGDLPTNYNITNQSPTDPDNGARHILGDLWLGATIDGEVDGQESATATGDVPDEDGVTPTKWDDTIANGGSVDVFVTGGSGCLSAWVDWNNNGDFNDTLFSVAGGFIPAPEQIANRVAVSAGTNTISFTVPDTPDIFTGAGANVVLNARYRLIPDTGTVGCSDETLAYTGEVNNGEVEDYQWTFLPTAVNLQSFTPAANSTLPVIGFVGFLALAIVSLGAIIVRREQKRA